MNNSTARVAFWAACGLLLLGSAVQAKAGKRTKKKVKVKVAGVLSTSEDQYVVVLRTDSEPHRYLPIWIGEMEALAIQLRLENRAPPRPLTLNLLESVLGSSRIRVVGIAIDDLSSGVFIGSVRLKQNGRSWNIDARPSDAIGLAVGQKAPIWVSEHVLQDAALDPDHMEDPRAVPPAPKTSGYEETL